MRIGGQGGTASNTEVSLVHRQRMPARSANGRIQKLQEALGQFPAKCGQLSQHAESGLEIDD
jgi:hypothetical protein